MIDSARALVLRDLRLLWRRRGDALQPAVFALLVVMLFGVVVAFAASRIRFPALPVPRFPARVFSSFLRKKENVAFSPQISYICRL